MCKQFDESSAKSVHVATNRICKVNEHVCFCVKEYHVQEVMQNMNQ